MSYLRSFVVALAIAFALPSLAFQLKVSDIARATDSHYNQLKTFKADFTEIYQAPGVSRTETGVLWLKKPGRMRWEYRQPRQKLFLSDSHTAFFYVPGERQAGKRRSRTLTISVRHSAICSVRPGWKKNSIAFRWLPI